MGMGHGMVYMRVGHHKVVKLMTGGAAGGAGLGHGGSCTPLPHLDPPMIFTKNYNCNQEIKKRLALAPVAR